MPAFGDRTEVGELLASLYETAAVVRARGEEVARSVGQTQARWQVLFTLSEGRLPAPGLARRLALTRQSVQRVIDLLAAERLVRAVANPSHRRSPLFELTGRGRRTLRQVNAAATGWHDAVRATLGPEELGNLRHMLGALRAVAGDGAADRAGEGPARRRRPAGAAGVPGRR